MTQPVRPPSGQPRYVPGGEVGPTVTLERVGDSVHVRFNRWLTTIALILGIMLMASTVASGAYLFGALVHALHDRSSTTFTTPDSPDPDATTGCPFGPNECGG